MFPKAKQAQLGQGPDSHARTSSPDRQSKENPCISNLHMQTYSITQQNVSYHFESSTELTKTRGTLTKKLYLLESDSYILGVLLTSFH